jgi:hypothetical protein
MSKGKTLNEGGLRAYKDTVKVGAARTLDS